MPIRRFGIFSLKISIFRAHLTMCLLKFHLAAIIVVYSSERLSYSHGYVDYVLQHAKHRRWQVGQLCACLFRSEESVLSKVSVTTWVMNTITREEPPMEHIGASLRSNHVCSAHSFQIKEQVKEEENVHILKAFLCYMNVWSSLHGFVK